MRGIIGFEEFQLICIIGAYDEERKNKQSIFIDVKMEVDLGAAIESDSLVETVDYGEVMRYIEEEYSDRTYYLIETLAAMLSKDLLEKFKAYSIVVKVKKPLAAYPVKWAICEIEEFAYRSEEAKVDI
jgi:7,8-dihydroneopterin aldolase/epimerase/oxygenase